MSVPAPTHLSELCDEVSLDRKTVIPDEIFRRLLESSGCNIQSDPKLVRVLNFVTQKFIAQIAYDVQQDVLLRNNEASRNDKNRTVLLTDDLLQALNDNGLKLTKPIYHVASPAPASKSDSL